MRILVCNKLTALCRGYFACKEIDLKSFSSCHYQIMIVNKGQNVSLTPIYDKDNSIIITTIMLCNLLVDVWLDYSLRIYTCTHAAIEHHVSCIFTWRTSGKDFINNLRYSMSKSRKGPLGTWCIFSYFGNFSLFVF